MRRRKLKSFRSADMTWSYKRLRFFGVFRALRAKCQVRGCHLEQKLSSDAQDEKNNKFVFPRDISYGRHTGPNTLFTGSSAKCKYKSSCSKSIKNFKIVTEEH